MAGFKMDDYVDVAERIRNFAERFPEGSLQSEMTLLGDGWLCKAFAFRSPTDERPGIGHAFEPVPGRTPYTKDSEAMNAETSAWGRAIVALGFETKKIASAQEVKARQDTEPEKPAFVAPAAKPTVQPSVAALTAFRKLTEEYKKAAPDFDVNAAVKSTEGKDADWLQRASDRLRKNIAAALEKVA